MMNKLKIGSLLAILVLLGAACSALAPAPDPTPVPEPTRTPEPPDEDELLNIVDTAVAAGNFETLVAAVEAADLVEALKSEGPFTVFAPTDEAFAALPQGTLETLLADPAGDLTQILLYHVVPGKVMAADVSDGLEAETLQGADVSFSAEGDTVMIDGATIVSTDIEAANGVIHVIDAVILPPTEEETATFDDDIVETAIEAGSFETLLAALEAAGLVEALQDVGPYTVFAPTDAAFNALPGGTLETLLADPMGNLSQILLYHVVPGKVMAADLSDGLEVETLQGDRVTVSIEGDIVMINDAAIVSTDIEAANGVIHVIDAVILPPSLEDANMIGNDLIATAIEAGSFDTLVAAIEAAGLDEALQDVGPYTVLAPTDAAFAALPEGTLETLLQDPLSQLSQILLYHVVPGRVMAADLSDGLEAETLQGATVSFSVEGDVVKVNGADVVSADIEAANGVIHVIDTVLLPPAGKDTSMMELDIVNTAIRAGGFETLVGAIEAAGLTDALRDVGPYTVFAPTSEAFAALPDGTLEALMDDPLGQLNQILLYHVVPGKVMAADLSDGLEVETLQGASVTFSIEGDVAKINDANIITTDIAASNGVIHVIDAVILPPE
jgi:uncharacterized surface protein with fasciclin (FAS1) repeats